MAHSYKWYVRRRAREIAWLQAQLDLGVIAGVLYKTEDGKYGLTEWLKDRSRPSRALRAAATGG